jgi:hypothetical protein
MGELSRSMVDSTINIDRRGLDSSGVVELHVPAFERMFNVSVQIGVGGSKIADATFQTLNDIANLTSESKTRIFALLYDDALRAKQEIAFGDPNPPSGQPPSSFLPRIFWRPKQYRFVPLDPDDSRHPCHFQNGIDSVEEKVEWLGFRIDENQALKNRFALLDCRPKWEDEHGVTIVMRNGSPISIDDYSLDLKKYDDA